MNDPIENARRLLMRQADYWDEVFPRQPHGAELRAAAEALPDPKRPTTRRSLPLALASNSLPITHLTLQK